MTTDHTSHPVPGWVGGFEQSNPAFAYPTPDLSSLKMLDNMANIDLLQRQQGVEWPEFSWESRPGEPDPKRCFQMFSPYISRLGYTNEGRVYSIICPQQGACSPTFGCMNVEVTVTGQRGWVNEETKQIAADMTVEGTIWFSPSTKSNPLIKLLWHHFKKNGHPFPISKANAIKVTTHMPGNPKQAMFPVMYGETTQFESPDFAKHPEAWSVGNLQVEIGPIQPHKDAMVNELNQLVRDVFNTASGNMLKSGNILTWNVWFKAPRYVDQTEWAHHAAYWRASIDADHGSPTGPGTEARYFNGDPFRPIANLLDEEIEKVHTFISNHL